MDSLYGLRTGQGDSLYLVLHGTYAMTLNLIFILNGSNERSQHIAEKSQNSRIIEAHFLSEVSDVWEADNKSCAH